MKKMRKKLRSGTVEAYGCIACYSSPDGCVMACGSNFDALQNGIQAQLDVQYLTIYC